MAYVKTTWQNSPSTNTPINATNLNHIEQGIYDAAATADQAESGVEALDPRMDLVEQRLDNLIPEGTPTQGNAELIDIRVGANGVTYPDAGSAVRGQVTEINSALTAKLTVFKNLYNPNASDIELNGFYKYNTGVFTANNNVDTSGFIEVEPLMYYRCGQWTTEPTTTQVTFWDENKDFVSGIAQIPNGWVQIPSGCKYINFPVSKADKQSVNPIVFVKGKELPPSTIDYGEETAKLNDTDLKNEFAIIDENHGYFEMTYFAETSGALKKDGTVDTSFSSIKIHKYTVSKLNYVYLDGSVSLSSPYCDLWTVKNGLMVKYIIGHSGNTYNKTPIYVGDSDEIWLGSQNLSLYQDTLIDKKARDAINRFSLGEQWQGKSWYAYGTSITSVHQGTGKYPTYLAQMSGMILTEKGIGGGGIGNLGAYSQGQVYDAICNITDGKLGADLITLETGANDVNQNVPLGTIYDEGQSTLAGCLNDCLRYLQENTTAQIVVTVSPATTTKPDAISQYYTWAAMVEQICNINRVHFVNGNNNMGYAKLASAQGSDYVVDSIHQTDLGGYIMAENLWYQLRNIPIFRTSLPS